jgi:hypothetical protein
VAPEVFGDAEGGDDLGGGKVLKAFRKNRQDQLDQIRLERQDALRAGCEIGAAGESLQIHPGHGLLEESLTAVARQQP